MVFSFSRWGRRQGILGNNCKNVVHGLKCYWSQDYGLVHMLICYLYFEKSSCIDLKRSVWFSLVTYVLWKLNLVINLWLFVCRMYKSSTQRSWTVSQAGSQAWIQINLCSNIETQCSRMQPRDKWSPKHGTIAHNLWYIVLCVLIQMFVSVAKAQIEIMNR